MNSIFLLIISYWLLPFTTNPGGKVVSQKRIESAIEFITRQNLNCNEAIFIDMSLPSGMHRLFVIDLTSHEVVYSTWVSHGKGSGTGAFARRFSNIPNSHCTSLGRYKIGEKYDGINGESYRLEGLDKSNSNAMKRDIVFHSAWYVSEEESLTGRVGNSYGCPAVSICALDDIRSFLKMNTLIWIYR
jgi:hypothetical protein